MVRSLVQPRLWSATDICSSSAEHRLGFYLAAPQNPRRWHQNQSAFTIFFLRSSSRTQSQPRRLKSKVLNSQQPVRKLHPWLAEGLNSDYIFSVASVAPLCRCCRLRGQSLGTRARKPSLIVSCQSDAFPRSGLPQTPSVFPPLEPREMSVCHIRLSILEWMAVPCLQVNHPA